MNKKLKIAMVTNNYTPYSGGVVSSIEATTEQLQKLGHEVFIIALNFLGEQHEDLSHVKRIPSLLRFRYKQNHMAIPWRAGHHVEKLLKEIKPDIVHVHHPFLLGKHARNAAQKLNIPVVFTYHTIYEAYTHYAPLPGFITKPWVKKRALSFCASVDGVIAPSNFIRSYLQQNSITKKVQIIPSGIQPDFVWDSLPAKNRSENKPFNLLCVTRFRKEKNLEFLLDVAAQLSSKNNKLTLVGYGDQKDHLKTYAYEKLGLSERAVQFVHAPPRPIIVKHYQEADLFLFSSKTDTQGLVLAEAMAAGTPVVAVDGPGQRDIIEQGKNGFLVDTADQMVHKIKEIARDKQLHQQLQQGAWETGKQYSAEKMAEKLVGFYQSIS